MEKFNWGCNVKTCVFNENGEKCTKKKINITNCKEEKTAHFCQDYKEEK